MNIPILATFFQRLADYFSKPLVVDSCSSIRPVSYPKAEHKDWIRTGAIIDVDSLESFRGLQGSALQAELQCQMIRHIYQQTGAKQVRLGLGNIGGALGGFLQ